MDCQRTFYRRLFCFVDISISTKLNSVIGAYSVVYEREEITFFADVIDTDRRYIDDSNLAEISMVNKCLVDLCKVISEHSIKPSKIFILTDSKKAIEKIYDDRNEFSRYYKTCYNVRSLMRLLDETFGAYTVSVIKVNRKKNTRAHRLCYNKARELGGFKKEKQKEDIKIEEQWNNHLSST